MANIASSSAPPTTDANGAAMERPNNQLAIIPPFARPANRANPSAAGDSASIGFQRDVDTGVGQPETLFISTANRHDSR